ncbi:MAG: hypothetical protein RLZZ608_347 [Actinomycetota bacterium]
MYAASPFTTCSPSGRAADPAAEIRRQIVLVDDLMDRVSSILTMVPDERAFDSWWGVARDACQQSLGIERARLARQVERLYGVRVQLDVAASQAAAASVGGQP